MKITSNILLGVFATFALTAVPACDDKKADDKKADDKKAGDEKKAPEAKPEEHKEEAKPADAAPAGDAPAAEAGAAEPAAGEGGGGADKIGIPECDEYMEKYTKCLNEKVPEAQRGAMQEGLDTMVKAWKEAAAGPGKDGLATACKAAMDGAKQSMGAMGCEF